MRHCPAGWYYLDDKIPSIKNGLKLFAECTCPFDMFQHDMNRLGRCGYHPVRSRAHVSNVHTSLCPERARRHNLEWLLCLFLSPNFIFSPRKTHVRGPNPLQNKRRNPYWYIPIRTSHGASVQIQAATATVAAWLAARSRNFD